MMEFEPCSHQEGAPPLYRQIMDQIRAAVSKGVIQPGSVLPSIGEMERQTGASSISVRRALQDLAAGGEVIVRSGVRAEIAQPWNPSLLDPHEAGAVWGDDVSVLSDSARPAGDSEAGLLEVAPGTPIHRWESIDYVDLRPARLRTSLVLLPDHFGPIEEGVMTGDPLVDVPALEVDTLQGWTMIAGARMGTAEERERLGMEHRDPSVLVVDHVYINMEGETVASQRLILPGASYRYAAEFTVE